MSREQVLNMIAPRGARFEETGLKLVYDVNRELMFSTMNTVSTTSYNIGEVHLLDKNNQWIFFTIQD